MSIEVITGIVTALLGALAAWWLNQSRSLKTLPKPIACASDKSNDVVSRKKTAGGYELEYDFNKFNSVNNDSFVSLVYSFSEPVSLVHFGGLKFSVIDRGDDLKKIDIEIKGITQNTLTTLTSESFSLPKDGILEWTFDKHEKINIHNVNEICFVVKPNYCKNGTSAKGKFEISGLAVRKQIIPGWYIDIT